MPLASETSVKVTIVSVGTPCECASAGDGSAERRVVIVRIAIIIAIFLGRLIGLIPIMDTLADTSATLTTLISPMKHTHAINSIISNKINLIT